MNTDSATLHISMQGQANTIAGERLSDIQFVLEIIFPLITLCMYICMYMEPQRCDSR